MAGPQAEAARRTASARLAQYNAVLSSVCASVARCRWDGGVVFRHLFARTDFSTVDYFHPSVAGQRAIADITWRAGYWA